MGPLNALLWGCESWSLSKHNLNKFTALHHSAIRRILGIKWSQVKHIKNKEVRGILCNYSILMLIFKRTAAYLNNNTYPKKFLAAWITGKRKNGAPQLTCNNNFANSIKKSYQKKNFYQTNKPCSANGSLLPKTKPIGKHILTSTLKPAAILTTKSRTIIIMTHQQKMIFNKKQKTQMA